jgi:predicted nucleic acid-binding protein
MVELLVLDASAIIDAAKPGPRFDALSRLQERFSSTAPALLAWELGSVIHGRSAAAFGRTPAARAKALDLMLAGIDLVATDEGSRARCGALAQKRGLTFYDASYLELASRDDATCLLTHDKALLSAAQRELGAGRASGLDDADVLLARVGA